MMSTSARHSPPGPCRPGAGSRSWERAALRPTPCHAISAQERSRIHGRPGSRWCASRSQVIACQTMAASAHASGEASQARHPPAVAAANSRPSGSRAPMSDSTAITSAAERDTITPWAWAAQALNRKLAGMSASGTRSRSIAGGLPQARHEGSSEGRATGNQTMPPSEMEMPRIDMRSSPRLSAEAGQASRWRSCWRGRSARRAAVVALRAAVGVLVERVGDHLWSSPSRIIFPRRRSRVMNMISTVGTCGRSLSVEASSFWFITARRLKARPVRICSCPGLGEEGRGCAQGSGRRPRSGWCRTPGGRSRRR